MSFSKRESNSSVSGALSDFMLLRVCHTSSLLTSWVRLWMVVSVNFGIFSMIGYKLPPLCAGLVQMLLYEASKENGVVV
ncbi:hypothetical protein VNO77_41642 [Canavalia gladiata]|uniref:Uncharacterized protein n=1 Tax=Canavalia gladiata TaxID=3824 RepID=A0AAN9K129_CANGL